jgi:hypothetical protein
VSRHVPGKAARAEAERRYDVIRDMSAFDAYVARTLDTDRGERNWRVGAVGEESAGRRLVPLERAGWQVLHSVPIGMGRTDIDHVLIGRGGVFTLNTKHHPGAKIWVGGHALQINGRSTDYLRKSRAEGERASKRLTAATGFDVLVQPVLVIDTETPVSRITVKEQPDVWVFGMSDLPDRFARTVPRLDPAQVDAIFEQARRCTTWTGADHCVCPRP